MKKKTGITISTKHGKMNPLRGRVK